MGFWKKKDKSPPSSSASSVTNPFESDATSSVYSSAPPSYHSQPSSGGSRYAPTRNEADYESQRRDLFGSAPSGRYNRESGRDVPSQEYRTDTAYRGPSRYVQDEEDEEVAGYKQQIRDVKQDSLQSTRNALQKIYETEQSASSTMNMLGQQSTQIANVDRNLDLAKAYSDRASAQASELKQLNRSIFIPVITNPFNKSKREQEKITALQRDQAEHMAEREKIRQFEYESNLRIEQANRRNERTSANAGYRRGRSEADRQRYQFEADSEDDQIEDEIDHNLDLLGDATARLKNMAITMNEEIDSQNRHLDKVTHKVGPLSDRLIQTTYTLNNTR